MSYAYSIAIMSSIVALPLRLRLPLEEVETDFSSGIMNTPYDVGVALDGACMPLTWHFFDFACNDRVFATLTVTYDAENNAFRFHTLCIESTRYGTINYLPQDCQYFYDITEDKHKDLMMSWIRAMMDYVVKNHTVDNIMIQLSGKEKEYIRIWEDKFVECDHGFCTYCGHYYSE